MEKNHVEKIHYFVIGPEKTKSWKIHFEEKKSHENKQTMWRNCMKNQLYENKLILEKNACENINIVKKINALFGGKEFWKKIMKNEWWKKLHVKINIF